MVRDDGEQVHLVITHSVMNAFRAEISVNKPFFEKGYLSLQAEIAFQFYIVHLRKTRRSKQHTTLDTHNAKLQQGLLDLKEGIITYLVSEGYWDDYSTTNKRIIEKHLKEAIKYARNITDPRPVNSWIRRLFEAKLIEGVDPHVYKFTSSEAEIEQPQEQIDNIIKDIQTGQNTVKQEQQQHEFKRDKDIVKEV